MRKYIALPFADMHTSFPQAIESDMHLNRVQKKEENHYKNVKEILMHNNQKKKIKIKNVKRTEKIACICKPLPFPFGILNVSSLHWDALTVRFRRPCECQRY